ncbi:hypothetical protein ABW19_dt0200132 [Dactylella cylindrospora]|nr:hypothetical protein ABW19_dt0200132 [Dactylella cylindrospora]
MSSREMMPAVTPYRAFQELFRAEKEVNIRADSRSYRIPKWFASVHPKDTARLPKMLLDAGQLLDNERDEHGIEEFVDDIARYIYCSNSIEAVGLDRFETYKLVKALLRNFPDPLDKSNFQTILDDSVHTREVIQHLQALVFFKAAIKSSSQGLTEELLLDTHRILMRGIPSEDGYTDYEGSYRTCQITVGGPLLSPQGDTVECSPPAAIQQEMTAWIESFNFSLADTTDPIANASRLKIKFLKIHPFLDGNGRMSRMLFTIIITRYYDNLLVCFAENAKGRNKYQSAVRQSIRQDRWSIFAFYALRQAAKDRTEKLERLENLDERHDQQKVSETVKELEKITLANDGR